MSRVPGAPSLLLLLLVLLLGEDCVSGKLFHIEPRHPLEGKPPPPGSPWPAPQLWYSSPKQRLVNPDIAFISSAASVCDVLAKAFDRYRTLIFYKPCGPYPYDSSSERLTILYIEVLKPYDERYPKQGDAENYTLEIPDVGPAVLEAETVWGALRGLETFSQLVHINAEGNAFVVNVTAVVDYPTYSYRGILLDSARHFLPVKILKQNLDAMSYNKFNVFHWHIVDDQSWPLAMVTYPNLTQSAYTPRHIYSLEEVQDVIEYARLRGIRVIPEIDSPGHTGALGKAFPNILTHCYKNGKRDTPDYPEHAARENLDPTNPQTYRVMTNIFREIRNVFKDEYIHLGMDEVYYACWKSSPEIRRFMEAHNFTSISQVEEYYVTRTLSNVKRLGSKYIIWQDPIENDVQVDRDTLVQVWKGDWKQMARRLARKGHKMVLSTFWYLDYISYAADWKKYYKADPRDFSGTESEKQLVVGGEACLWSEYVDATNLIARLWPRASAVAERLWSSPSVNDVEEAKYRLDEHRCRMRRRGIAAQPILNGFCGDEDLD
ncbi:unnamed protein product [Ixodes persulcatus]